MSEQEKKAAKELLDDLKKVPADGADYVRGYLRGRLDGLKNRKDEESDE